MQFRIPPEFDYYLAPDGSRYDFDNGADKFMFSFTGYGMPPIEYVKQRGPFQHGETLLDYRLQSRVVQLEHRRQATMHEGRQGYWENRADVLNWLRPNRQLANSFGLGTLVKILPDNTKRNLDVLVQQGPVFAAQSIDTGEFLGWTDIIQFIAPDPTFYNPAQQTTIWAITVLLGKIYYSAFAPTELKYPYFYGLDVVSGSTNITYPGTWLTYPTITFIGPLNQPVITNNTTNEKIQLSYNIAAGETVTVDLAFGNKTVTNNFGANLIGVVTPDSDLATFHIAPDPEAAGGVNNLTVSGGGGSAGLTQIQMSYYTRYIGI